MRKHKPPQPAIQDGQIPEISSKYQEVRKIKICERQKRKKRCTPTRLRCFYLYNYPRAMSALLVVHLVEIYVYVLLYRPPLHLCLYP